MKATQAIIDQRKRREAKVKTESNNSKVVGFYYGDAITKNSDSYTKYNQDLTNEFEGKEWPMPSNKPLCFKIPSELMCGVYKTGDHVGK